MSAIRAIHGSSSLVLTYNACWGYSILSLLMSSEFRTSAITSSSFFESLCCLNGDPTNIVGARFKVSATSISATPTSVAPTSVTSTLTFADGTLFFFTLIVKPSVSCLFGVMSPPLSCLVGYMGLEPPLSCLAGYMGLEPLLSCLVGIIGFPLSCLDGVRVPELSVSPTAGRVIPCFSSN